MSLTELCEALRKGNFRFPLLAFSPRVGEGRLLSGFVLSFFAEGKRRKERRHRGKRVQMFSLIPKRACSGFLRRPIRERRSGNPTGEAIIRGPEGRGGNGRRWWQELRRAPWFSLPAGRHSAAAAAPRVFWTGISCATAKPRVFLKNSANAMREHTPRTGDRSVGGSVPHRCSPVTCLGQTGYPRVHAGGSGRGRRLPPLNPAGRSHN